MKQPKILIVVLLLAVSLVGYKVYQSQTKPATGDLVQAFESYQESGKPTLVFFGSEDT